jgi:hypothetical protein
MNNQNISKYISDSEARFGAKGKNNIWLGYKRHLSVDMSNGLINKDGSDYILLTNRRGDYKNE